MREKHNLSLEEVEKDLRLTEEDLTYLRTIVVNLEKFINNDVNRDHFKTFLLLFKVTVESGEELLERIKKVYETLKQTEKP